tara:strand:+ start:2284 stop:2484 length:201 start_codon:yes stop_codon:yes gene_type:complete
MFRYLGQRIFNATIEKPVMKKIVDNINKTSNTKKLVNFVDIQNKDNIKNYNQNFNLKSKVEWNKEW